MYRTLNVLWTDGCNREVAALKNTMYFHQSSDHLDCNGQLLTLHIVLSFQHNEEQRESE